MLNYLAQSGFRPYTPPKGMFPVYDPPYNSMR
jgi:hypothetical protein